MNPFEKLIEELKKIFTTEKIKELGINKIQYVSPKGKVYWSRDV